MKKLNCFVIIPTNREGEGSVKLLRDKRHGLVEFPSGCKEAISQNNHIDLNFDDVYEQIIKAAIEKVNFDYKEKDVVVECFRGRDILEAGDILAQVIEWVCRADIVIVDVTTNNPNVILEYGIRLIVKSDLNIMIRYEGVELPFDIKQLRCINYSMDIKGANKAKSEIAEFISNFIDYSFTRDKSAKSKISPLDQGFFKSRVELYTGRLMERELVKVFEKTPRLVADFASFLLANKKSTTLKQELFDFFDSLYQVLKKDPSGQARAIECLELVSNIEDLSPEKLEETYYRLWELYNATPNFKQEARYYLEKLEQLEEDNLGER